MELKIWRAVLAILSWSVQKLRNDCVFSAQFTSEELSEVVKTRIALCTKSYLKGLSYLAQDLISNLSQVRQCIGGGFRGEGIA
ncbi:unnamed protein product [Camellia sinensis]